VYKSSTDFVAFGRSENDNIIESLPWIAGVAKDRARTKPPTRIILKPWNTMGLLVKSIRKRPSRQSKPELAVPDWLRERRPCSYWAATRRPFPSLLLVAPLILAYEAGVMWLGGDAAANVRTGADTWMRSALVHAGLTDHWLPPLGLLLILMGWQILSFYDWRFSPAILAGMVIESIVWAVTLIGVSRLIDLGFAYLEHGDLGALAIDQGSRGPSIQSVVGYLGAGVYEEALFRLILVPILFGVLRLLQAPQVLASSLAVTGSALLFALAHHAGTPAESFTWFAFIFRWMAGVFFAWVFVIRGFGIAVGTHTGYDILVGCFGWRF
jgi:Type II CAAX prenyl endopeptidase Rce1-like